MLAQTLHNIPKYMNEKHVLIHNQNVGDIMQGIVNTHNKYKADYDKIYKQFEGRNIIDTARNVYNYLKNNTYYVIESDNKQTLRSPAAIIALGKNPKIGLDCKSYSLFIGGILDAFKRHGKKFDWCYRFASYKITDRLPHHVFVVINPNTDKEIFVDPVLSTFNNRKIYHFKIDRKPMALIAIAGIGRKSKQDRKEHRQAIKQKLKEKIKKAGKIFLKFNPATATARNAFLLLVKLNIFNLAFDLNKIKQKGEEGKLIKLWTSIGGKYTNLNRNIGLGLKHKHHKKMSGIGVVAVATATTTSIPILIKIKDLLKSVGIDPEKLQKEITPVIKSIVNKKIEDAVDKIEKKGSSSDGTFDIPDSAADSFNENESVESPTDSADDSSNDSGDEMGAISNNNLILGGAALVGVYFLLKK
jgi:hypothetical protein